MAEKYKSKLHQTVTQFPTERGTAGKPHFLPACWGYSVTETWQALGRLGSSNPAFGTFWYATNNRRFTYII